MTSSQIIVLATPVFFLLIAVEFAWGLARGRNTYRLNDAINSIGLGMLSQVSAVFTRVLRVGIYTAVYSSVALVALDDAQAFWNTWYGWVLAVVFYDFCYYWLHRAGHEVAVFWAAHVVHHQSQDYNLSTALRQTSSGVLLGWLFYLPMALAGVPPHIFAIVALIDLLYQYWVHTEHVPRLGWFDRWFCSPSNHRVHHAVNDLYVDRNYGGILIIWDRMFGSFREEDEREPCVYGTRSPLGSWDPLWANAEVYWALLKDSWRARSWADKLRVWFKPPGWRPADVAARWPKPAFDIGAVQRYHPPMSRALMIFALAQFVLMLAAVAVFLWFAESVPRGQAAVWGLAFVAGLWALGAATQGRVGMWECLAIQAAGVAMATSATGLVELHRVFKPAVMLLLVAAVLWRAHSQPDSLDSRSRLLLVLALLASLAGDVFLMFPGYFIQGLVSFLVAHLFYIALFRQGVPWLASRRGALAVLAYGLCMYVVLWVGGLPAGLRVPVALYVVAIGLMAAQAIGRAQVHALVQTRPQDRWSAVAVAVGAGLFMLSDTLLAINRFVSPLPWSPVWVLCTYYAAQVLIVTRFRSIRAEN